MTSREQILQDIINIIEPIDEITEDTEIKTSDDIDSLALFNIVLYLNTKGKKPTLEQLQSLNKVKDIIDIACND